METMHNFRTGQPDLIPDAKEGDWTDFIPQDEVAQALYQGYLDEGLYPSGAALRTLLDTMPGD